MATKALPVGKGLLLQVKNTRRGGDSHKQVLIVPNLPNETGDKSGETMLFSRHYDPTHSRNEWTRHPQYHARGAELTIDSGLTVPLSDLTQMEDEQEEDEYYYSAPRTATQKKVTLKALSELEDDEKPEAHYQLILATVLDQFIEAKSKWNKDEKDWDFFEVVPNYTSSTDTVIPKVNAYPIEITDRDMTEIQKMKKIPSALAKRIQNVYLRPALPTA